MVAPGFSVKCQVTSVKVPGYSVKCQVNSMKVPCISVAGEDVQMQCGGAPAVPGYSVKLFVFSLVSLCLLLEYEGSLFSHLRMLVASLEATAGSVMAKAERISPLRRGSSHRFFCSGVPVSRGGDE